VPASATLMDIIRWGARRVSNVSDSPAHLPSTVPAKNHDNDDDDDDDDGKDKDDKNIDNKGTPFVPSWKLVASRCKKAKQPRADVKQKDKEDTEEEKDGEETEEEKDDDSKGDDDKDTEEGEDVDFRNEDEEEDEEEEESVADAADEDFVPDADDDKAQNVAAASAHHLIPTAKKQRKSSIVNLHTNGPDPPKFNLLHKAQQAVATAAPGFGEALDRRAILPQMMHLCQHCLAKPKDSFFISAGAHIQVISQACGLTTKAMLKMRGCFF
jgi:hypothetical protein